VVWSTIGPHRAIAAICPKGPERIANPSWWQLPSRSQRLMGAAASGSLFEESFFFFVTWRMGRGWLRGAGSTAEGIGNWEKGYVLSLNSSRSETWKITEYGGQNRGKTLH